MASQEDSRMKSSIRRSKYKQLLDVGSTIESNAENESLVSTLKKIAGVAQRSDELNSQGRYQDRVENTTEVVMDAQVMKMTHELLGAIIQTMDNTEVTDDEFLTAIHRTTNNNDWDKLAEIGISISTPLFYSQSLFGTFDEETVVPQKEAKERQKNTKTKNTQEVKPINVETQENDAQAAQEINMAVSQILQLYKANNNQPIPYYKLIIDPNNFMRTIQNSFQMSFLFRDGIIALQSDENGYPTVRPTTNGDKTGVEGKSMYQMVSMITPEFCDKMIERYAITEACMSWSN